MIVFFGGEIIPSSVPEEWSTSRIFAFRIEDGVEDHSRPWRWVLGSTSFDFRVRR